MSEFYIKKPIPIEAYKFDPARKADYIVNLEYADGGKGVDCKWGIQTLEGMHEVKIGDWIITGVRGERYPIKGDIFEETYTAATGAGGDGEMVERVARATWSAQWEDEFPSNKSSIEYALQIQIAQAALAAINEGK